MELPPELLLADRLLASLEAVLAENPNPPALVALRVGEEVRQDASIYEDECCDGLAYVKINQVYPSTNEFPVPDETPLMCSATRWAVDLEMGVFRCSPIGDEKHVATSDEWNSAATQVALDSHAMRVALAGFLSELEEGTESVTRPWLPLGPQGGCAGGTQIVTVGFIKSYC